MSAVRIKDQVMTARVNVSILVSDDAKKAEKEILKLLADAEYVVDSSWVFRI